MKQFKLTFLLTMLMSMVVVKVVAHGIEVANAEGVLISYTFINNNTELEVSPGDYSGEVIIPESVAYNGNVYRVTSIGGAVFYGDSNLTSVIIPSSVTSIGTHAFYGCSSLTSINIPESVSEIGSCAFNWCQNLVTMTVDPNNLVYDSRDNCNAIIETSSNALVVGCINTIIPSSVTTIGEYAFEGCRYLATISIPSSVTSIGEGAFLDCDGLTSLTINTSTVGSWFSEMENLSEVIFGNNVKEIGDGAFLGCNNLTSITIPSSVMCIGNSAFYLCNSLTSITIPSSVTSIGEYAFDSCSNLISIIISEGVTSIGECAFARCSRLTSITIPSSVTNIVEGTFQDCNGLTSIILSEGVSSISNTAFSGCSGLTSITIPSSVTSIDVGTFKDCHGLTKLTINTPAIGSWFSEMENLSELIIGNSVTAIGDNAFLGCIRLSTVTFGSNVISIGNNAFDGCRLSSIELPSSLTTIGQYAFIGCNLTSIEIPSSVTSIGDYAFWLCEDLTSATIHEGVTNIGNNAFEGCIGLKSITIPSSVTTFGSLAFYNCKGLTSVIISEGVRIIGEEVFEGCSSLTSIDIPSSVTDIGYAAFSGCSSLTSIDIPSSVTDIGYAPFSGCSELISITVDSNNTVYDSRDNCNAIIDTSSNTLISGCMNTIISSSVLSIGTGAFEGCIGLTSITIPSSVMSIGIGAFNGCSDLTSIEIPSSVTSIGDAAFQNCIGLVSVTVEKTEPIAITRDVFTNRANATLYVPAGSKAAYEAASYWGNFMEIVEYGAPEVKKYKLEVYGNVGIDLNESHLYDRDGNEYDYIGSGNNEFDEGSYIRISPFVGAALFIQEIIVNGESVGTWTEDNAPIEYVIESLSENTTVEFKTYLRAQWRTLGCIAEGPGKVEMYKNGNLIGTASSPDNYFSDVFECGDIIKLIIVPDAGSTLTQFLGGEFSADEALGENLLGEITDNAYSFTFNPDDIVNKYGYLVRFFKAIFEGPEPSITNTLSASVPILLVGKQATLSLNLTNEDELIAFEFDLQLPDGITIAKDEDNDPIATLSSRCRDHSLGVSDQGNGLYHFLCYSNTNKIISGNEGELLNIELLCDENTAVGTYQATVKNIIFSDVDKNKITPVDVTFDLEVIEAEPGDVNKDGEINVMDVVEMVAYIMGDGSEGFVFAAADLYPDGAINVMDLVNLVELIMNSSASNAREWTENSMSLCTLADGTVSVKVNNPEQYVASEFIVEVSAGQALETVTADKHHRVTCSQLDDSHYKVMAYSSANSTFNSDALVQLHISGEGMVNVHDALLVDESHKGVAFAPTAGGYTTGINQMENGKLIIENSSVYDLQGKKRDTSRPYKHEILIVNGKKQVVR